jgi:hypothetical protein
MKKIYLLTVLIIFTFNFSLTINNCFSQWEETQSVGGVGCMTISVFGSTIYAGTYNQGVYISTNGGLNWVRTDMNYQKVTSFTACGSYVFAGTYANGIYVSSNNGYNWTQTSLNTQSVTSFTVIGTNIFAGIYTQGIYKSTNYGTNWTPLGIGGYCYYLYSKDSIIYDCTSYGGLIYSTNLGESWYSLTTLPNNAQGKSFVIKDSIMFVGAIESGAGAGGVYVSTNNGLNWTNTLAGKNTYSMVCLGSNIFAAAANCNYIWQHGVWRSTNNGVSWTVTSLDSIECLSITVNGTKILTSAGAFATGGSVYISSNYGSSWLRSAVGNNQTVYSFAKLGTKLYAGCNYTDPNGPPGGIYLSTNNGINWSYSGLSYFGGAPVNTITVNDSNIFAGTDNTLERSSNGGQNWSAVLSGNKIKSSAYLSPYILAGTNGNGVYRSSNNGAYWPTPTLTSRIVNTLVVIGTRIYAGTNGYGVYYSTNSGLSWTQTSLNTQNVLTIIDNGDGTIIYAGTETNGVYRTNNNGVNWVQTSLNNKTVNSLASYLGCIIAGTNGYGVYSTSNFGATWGQRNEGLGDFQTVHALIQKEEYIFAGIAGKYVWRRSGEELMGMKNISGNTPSSYSLSQNYPNPFNPNTKIRFEIPSYGFPIKTFGNDKVVLKIYDVLGKEIATLVNEALQPGSYEVTYDGSNLASGIYFYRLTAGEYVTTKKMILLK